MLKSKMRQGKQIILLKKITWLILKLRLLHLRNLRLLDKEAGG